MFVLKLWLFRHSSH